MHSKVLDLPNRTGLLPYVRNLPAMGLLDTWSTALSMSDAFQQWVGPLRRKPLTSSAKGGRVSASGPYARHLKEYRGRSGEPAIELPFEKGRRRFGNEVNSPGPGELKAEHEERTAEKVADLLPAFPLSSRPIRRRVRQARRAAGPGSIRVPA